jgi:hypothetical protein
MDRVNSAFTHLKSKISYPILILLIAAVLSCLIYWFAMVPRVNLLQLYTRPRLDGTNTYWKDAFFRRQFVLAFAALGFFYWLGWRAARRAKGQMAWGIVLGGSFISCAALLWLYPFDAADMFDNIIHGRMLGIYGANPFLLTASAYSNDPFYPYMAWKFATSAYGPLWEILAGITARLAGNGILENILAFKLLLILFFTGCVGLTALILKRIAPKRALAGVLFIAWNPIILYETVGNGHNDIVMVFWILLAAWAINNRRYIFSILALSAGVLIKFIPLLLIPVAAILALRKLPDLRSRFKFLCTSGIASAIIIGAFYAPYWHGLSTLSIARRMQLMSDSIPAVIYHYLSPALGADRASQLVSISAVVLILLFVAWQGWHSRHHLTEMDFSQAAFNILIFYILATCLWFQQWYTLWPLGIAALLPAGHSSRLAVIFGFSALSKQFIVGPLLFGSRPFPPQPGLEFHFAIGVLGLSWLYAMLSLLLTLNPKWFAFLNLNSSLKFPFLRPRINP